MPDQEALEVALADLSDESENEASAAVEGEQQEPSEDNAAEIEQEAPAEEEKQAETEDTQTETKSQRRRRLRREREEKQADRLKFLEAENKRLEKRLGGIKEPDRRNYSNESEYLADRAAYNVRRETAQEDQQRLSTDFETTRAEEAQAFNDALMDFGAEGSEKYNDFTEKVSRPVEQGGPAITTVMTEALFETDHGVDIAYYLAQHPKESLQIAQMSPIAQVRKIYELEGKVSKANAPAKSAAPPPVKTVKSGKATARKPVSKMSMSEYAEFRQKQMGGGA